MIKRVFNWLKQPLGLIAVGIALLAVFSLAAYGLSLTQQPPEQTVQFPHKTHVAFGIQCLYCHPGASKGPAAGIPSQAKCWACHNQIVKTRDSALLAPLKDAVLSGQSLEWVGAYMDCVAGGLRYVPDVFQPQEPIGRELLDVYEDVILIGELASDKPRPTQRTSRGPEDGGDWFSWTGFGSQMGHEYHLQAKMHADEVPALIRSLYNSCAAEIDPDTGYTFWEAPFKVGAPNKTFEAAAFLEHVRNMLVMEIADAMWNARAPRGRGLTKARRSASRTPPPTLARWPTRSSPTWTTGLREPDTHLFYEEPDRFLQSQERVPFTAPGAAMKGDLFKGSCRHEISHTPFFARERGCPCYDTDKVTGELFKKRHGFKIYEQDYKEIVEKVNAVIICVPNFLHSQISEFFFKERRERYL